MTLSFCYRDHESRESWSWRRNHVEDFVFSFMGGCELFSFLYAFSYPCVLRAQPLEWKKNLWLLCANSWGWTEVWPRGRSAWQFIAQLKLLNFYTLHSDCPWFYWSQNVRCAARYENVKIAELENVISYVYLFFHFSCRPRIFSVITPSGISFNHVPLDSINNPKRFSNSENDHNNYFHESWKNIIRRVKHTRWCPAIRW